MKSVSLSLLAVCCLLLSAATQSVSWRSAAAPAWMLLASECEPGPHDDCSDSEDEDEDESTEENEEEAEPEIA